MSGREGRREMRSSSSVVELRLYSRVGGEEEVVVSSGGSLGLVVAVGRERRVESTIVAILRLGRSIQSLMESCGYIASSKYVLMMRTFCMW